MIDMHKLHIKLMLICKELDQEVFSVAITNAAFTFLFLLGFSTQAGMMVKWLRVSTGCRLCWYSWRKMLGDGDLDGGGGDGVLAGCWGPGKVRTMGGEGSEWILGIKSANKFRARPKGDRGRPNAESSKGMVGLT